MNAADAFFSIFGMTRECAHVFGAETSKRFRAGRRPDVPGDLEDLREVRGAERELLVGSECQC